MSKFELVLANGKRLESDHGSELYWFFHSRGASIRPPKRGKKRNRKNSPPKREKTE